MPKPHKDQTRDEYVKEFMADKDMNEKYPDEKQRYAVAMSEWKRKHNECTRLVVNMSSLVRKEMLDDEEYMVAPAVLIKEGVLNGVYYPAAELAQSAIHWNGMPVVVEHPTVNGESISANVPQVAAKTIGRVFNAMFEDGKLKAEIWLNTNKALKHASDVVTRLANNAMVELSTGLFTQDNYVQGEFGGKQYDTIAYSHRPDHLALLPHGLGACSIADGAGFPRINAQTNKGVVHMPEITFETKADFDAEVKKAVDSALADAIKANEAKLVELGTKHEADKATAIADALKANAAEVTFKTKADFDKEIELRVNAAIEAKAKDTAVAELKANTAAVQLPDAALAVMSAEQVTAYSASFKANAAKPGYEGKPAPKTNDSHSDGFVAHPAFSFETKA